MGLEPVRQIVELELPVIAIGGVTPERVSALRAVAWRVWRRSGPLGRCGSANRSSVDAGGMAVSNVIDIVINGEPKQVTPGATLLELLVDLELDPRTVVVEHNRRIVRRPALGEVTVAAGDAIELVHFVGGG